MEDQQAVFLTPDQIENLHHTEAPVSGFSKHQPNRFEILSSNVEGVDALPAEDAHLRWYDTQLESLFAFNYFSEQKYDCLLLSDMAKGGSYYCLCVGKDSLRIY